MYKLINTNYNYVNIIFIHIFNYKFKPRTVVIAIRLIKMMPAVSKVAILII